MSKRNAAALHLAVSNPPLESWQSGEPTDLGEALAPTLLSHRAVQSGAEVAKAHQQAEQIKRQARESFLALARNEAAVVARLKELSQGEHDRGFVAGYHHAGKELARRTEGRPLYPTSDHGLSLAQVPEPLLEVERLRWGDLLATHRLPASGGHLPFAGGWREGVQTCLFEKYSAWMSRAHPAEHLETWAEMFGDEG